MTQKVLDRFNQNHKNKTKQFAVLIDPDKMDEKSLYQLMGKANDAHVDWLFVGGSLLTKDALSECLSFINEVSEIPTVIFPGSMLQISDKADAIFLLSMISGRNPDLLIGQHVVAAPYLKETDIEVLPTGYVLIDGGRPTTVSYISNTHPIPADKGDIAACTALAGQMLGLKLIYMDSGSGAKHPVPVKVIQQVSSQIDIPLIVGGGITTPELAIEDCKAGADVIVVGNAIEKDPEILTDISAAIHSLKPVTS